MSVSGTEQIKNRPLISLCVTAHPSYKTPQIPRKAEIKMTDKKLGQKSFSISLYHYR